MKDYMFVLRESIELRLDLIDLSAGAFFALLGFTLLKFNFRSRLRLLRTDRCKMTKILKRS